MRQKELQAKVQAYQGNDKLLLGLFLAVITFGLFAQTILCIATTIRLDLGIDVNASNIAVSAAALFSGIFIVVIGGLGDKFGRLKMTKIGLLLSILGSLIISVLPKETATFLIIGRIIQGFSTACILPNALAVIKAYYEGAARQRAVSIYSIGSWGGAALSSLFGGLLASTLGWRWIYWLSIVVAIGSLVLISGVPESKNPASGEKRRFDLAGMITFMIGMLSINLVISQGGRLGWLSPLTLSLTAAAVITFVIFFKIEKHAENRFINFDLFRNNIYKGAALSNFLVNGAAGTLVVALSLVQLGAGMTALQAGYLTIGYPVAILIAIKVGEKFLQRFGARRPMVLGCTIACIGILLTSLTFIMTSQYIVVSTIGFAFFGFGLGLYATPSADAALSSIAVEEAGSASGIYRMASALGSAFGISISAAIFTGLSMQQITFVEGFFMGRTDNISIRYAAIIALLFNLFMVMAAIISIVSTLPAVPSALAGKREMKG